MDELDKLSEAIEREALVSLHENCPAGTRAALGLHLGEFGDALAAGAENDGSVLLNRTLGLATLQPYSSSAVQAVADAYREWGVARYFFHVYADGVGDDELAAFDRAGLERTRGWMKFRHDGGPIRERKTELRVERVGRDRAEHFGKIVCTAFGMTEAAVPLLAGIANDDRWHLLVSYDGDTPAGAGALFVDVGAAWLEWGATDPAFRRRGSQGAIMEARLRLAEDLGCEHVFTETGEAVDGDPQHSYGNIKKAGFVESVLRHNYAPRR